MNLLKLLIVPVVLAAAVAPQPAGVVGKTMPPIPIEGLSQTKAKSLDEYAGRAVLIEFFAYW